MASKTVFRRKNAIENIPLYNELIPIEKTRIQCNTKKVNFIALFFLQSVPRLLTMTLKVYRRTFRDRSKFTGYLGRVLGKIRPLFFSRKKSSPLIFSEKKSLRPLLQLKKCFRPLIFFSKKLFTPLIFFRKKLFAPFSFSQKQPHL